MNPFERFFNRTVDEEDEREELVAEASARELLEWASHAQTVWMLDMLFNEATRPAPKGTDLVQWAFHANTCKDIRSKLQHRIDFARATVARRRQELEDVI